MASNTRLRDIPKLASDGKNLPAVMEAVREALQTFRGYRGDALDRALTLRDLDDVTQRSVLVGGTLGSGGTTTIIGGGGGGGGGGTTPDPTPPPTAEGLVVTAGLSYIYIAHDQPVYTQGHGHQKTRVFGSKWATGDPTPPTFSEAVQLFEFEGPFGAYPTDTGTRWCIWIKWVSVDGYESTDPAGGTNGAQATTGKIGNADLNDLIITAGKLADGAVDLTTGKVTANGEFGALAVGYTVTQYLVATSGVMQNLIVDNAQIANLSAAKLLAGSIGVGAYIQSTGYSAGVTGWRIHGNGFAEFGAASIRGQLTAAQINSNGLSVKDVSGNIILDANTPLTAQYIGAAFGGGNLLPNSSFEVDSDNDGVADSWSSTSIGSGITLDRSFSTTASTLAHGSRSWRWEVSALSAPSTNVHIHLNPLTDCPRVVAGQRYSLSMFARTSTLSYQARIGVRWLDSADAQVGSTDAIAYTFSAANTIERVKHETLTAPAGAVKARVELGIRRPSIGDTTLGVMWFDAIQFEQADRASGYSPSLVDKVGIDLRIAAGNVALFMEEAAIGSAYISSLNADVINAGAIRGINVNASSHTTVGSYLTSAAAAAATVLQVKNTADFPASGTAFIIDSTNDRDTITYTGKTATSLTGCAGVLAHNAGATIIPRAKAMVIDARTNEMRYFGDRGDGVVQEIANIGTVPAALGGDGVVASFGSLVAGADNDAVVAYSNSGWGVRGESVSSFGVLGVSGQNVGVRGATSSTSTVHAGVQGLSGGGASVGVEGLASSTGPAVRGVQSGSGPAVFGDATSGPGVSGSSSTGYGGSFTGNATRAALFLTPGGGTKPSQNTLGQFAVLTTPSLGAVLCYANGSNWFKVCDNTPWNT